MRTTLTIDDDVAVMLERLRRQRDGRFKDVVNETLRGGLQKRSVQPKPYRLKTVSLGGVLGGLNLDKALSIADAFEDEEIARKLEMRK